MAAVTTLAGGIFAYLMYNSKKRNENRVQSKIKTYDRGIGLDPYQPFMFQNISDIIYSPQLQANEIAYTKRNANDGVYGMFQEYFSMNRAEPITLSYRTDNLLH